MKKLVTVCIDIYIDEQEKDIKHVIDTKLEAGQSQESIFAEVAMMSVVGLKELIEDEINTGEGLYAEVYRNDN